MFRSERLTGALLDRLTHHVHILEMNVESYRLKAICWPQRSRKGGASKATAQTMLPRLVSMTVIPRRPVSPPKTASCAAPRRPLARYGALGERSTLAAAFNQSGLAQNVAAPAAALCAAVDMHGRFLGVLISAIAAAACPRSP